MISMEYLLAEGTDVPEGTTVVECEKCHRKFAVPIGSNLMSGNVCEECAKMESAEAAADLKANPSDEVKAALGE